MTEINFTWFHYYIYGGCTIAGPDNLDNLRRLAEQFQKQAPGAAAAASGTQKEEDDDDVPDLVPGENFEETANKGEAS